MSRHCCFREPTVVQLVFSSLSRACLVPSWPGLLVGCVFAPRASASLLSLLFKLTELGIQAHLAGVGILRLKIDCVRVVEH